MIATKNTAWKVPKYVVIFGSYFPVLGLNTGKYGPEITPYLDSFLAVWFSITDTKAFYVTEKWKAMSGIYTCQELSVFISDVGSLRNWPS